MVTLVAVLLALGAGCPVTDIGTLGDGEGSVLQTAGCWTTEGCDSRFLTDTDAHTYLFRLAEDGQVRIDLTSAEGDSYLPVPRSTSGKSAVT